MSERDHRYLVNAEAAIHHDGDYLLVERAATEDHAAGTLGLVGGTVEATETESVLEHELAREVREEVGVGIADPKYVQSNAFTTDNGDPCVNVVCLCRHDEGDPEIAAPEEVAVRRERARPGRHVAVDH